MLPVATNGIGALQFPQLPPSPSGPNPTGPGQFAHMYDRLLQVNGSNEGPRLPTQMEVTPLISPAASLGQPFKASPEFPGAVDPNGLKVEGGNKGADARNDSNPGLTPFTQPFKEALGEVNKLQGDAEKLQNEAAVGGDVDLHDVMIASEKAGVAMQLTLQVRNKLVEAYQEVMRMQV